MGAVAGNHPAAGSGPEEVPRIVEEEALRIAGEGIGSAEAVDNHLEGGIGLEAEGIGPGEEVAGRNSRLAVEGVGRMADTADKTSFVREFESSSSQRSVRTGRFRK